MLAESCQRVSPFPVAINSGFPGLFGSDRFDCDDRQILQNLLHQGVAIAAMQRIAVCDSLSRSYCC